MGHNPNIADGFQTMANSYPVVIASDQTAVPIVGQTLTVGTQGTEGFSVQDLKDAGRAAKRYWCIATTPANDTQANMLTLTKSTDTAATSTASTFAITNGKIFRIQHIALGIHSASSSVKTCTFNIHVDTASTADTADPIVWSVRLPVEGGDDEWNDKWFEFPDGFEILGTSTLQFGVSYYSSSVSCSLDVMIIGYEY